MKHYIDENFLLNGEYAKRLYHEVAKEQPLIDYHTHLSIVDIASDKRWNDLAELWLLTDHYKWRQMRANGAEEYLCTGNASGFEKFKKWVETLQNSIGNPLYHWAHLELYRFFGIDTLLSVDTAYKIWNMANEVIQHKDFTCRNILKKMNVKVLCTTDDPCDSLEYHDKIIKDGFEIKVLPTFRPDRALGAENPIMFKEWIKKIETLLKISIRSFDDLLEALKLRADFFNSKGCRVADHGFTNILPCKISLSTMRRLFNRLSRAMPLSLEEINVWKFGLLLELGRIYAEKDWAWMLHSGVLRNVNSRMFSSIGPDTGFDIMANSVSIEGLVLLFDTLNKEQRLPKTILFNLNPSDSEAFITLLGAFQEGPLFNKMQYGPAWWFLDRKEKIESHLESLSGLGLLGGFVGMVTDSRSFLSFCRHEYFRRILCNWLGFGIEKKIFPDDFELMSTLVKNISFTNASTWFNFNF